MVLANPEFTSRIRQFAQRTDFQKIFRINAEQREKQQDIEYIVRMIAHTYQEFRRGLDVEEFLDQAIIRVLTDFDADEVLATVGWSVETLFRILGERALIPSSASDQIAPRFSLRALEAIVVGVARNRAAIVECPNPDQFILNKVTTFWQQPSVPEMSASGLRGTVRIQRTVTFGSTWFNPNG